MKHLWHWAAVVAARPLALTLIKSGNGAKTPPRFASIDCPDVVVLGDFAVEPDAALVYDRTAVLLHPTPGKNVHGERDPKPGIREQPRPERTWFPTWGLSGSRADGRCRD
jgi:hypothetical protein